MSLSETGALQAGKDGVVSPEQIKRTIASENAILFAYLEAAKKRIRELEETVARQDRQIADQSRRSRGVPQP